MVIDVIELVFDDANEAKFAGHLVTVIEVQEVLDNEPKFFRNRGRRRASHLMVGPTFGARPLTVPFEPWDEGLWRPVTAFDAGPEHAAR